MGSRAASAPDRVVAEVMRRDFVCVGAHERLDEALRIMRLARLRHLLVERDGALAGILSYRDLQELALARRDELPERADSPLPVPVAEAMMDSPYVVTPETRLSDAARRLCNLHIGCLPVVEDREAGPELVGIVTESDLLRAAYSS